MGFTPRRTVYILDFEGTDWDGAEVKMGATKLGAVFAAPALLGAQKRVAAGAGDVLPEPEDVDAMLGEFADLAAHLISWNIEDEDGNPAPADLDGLKAQELPFVMAIAQAWQAAMKDVAPPLPPRSSNGVLPDVLSAPMEPIPASLLSSSVPN
jgi:hypothetical protein